MMHNERYFPYELLVTTRWPGGYKEYGTFGPFFGRDAAAQAAQAVCARDNVIAVVIQPVEKNAA